MLLSRLLNLRRAPDPEVVRVSGEIDAALREYLIALGETTDRVRRGDHVFAKRSNRWVWGYLVR